MSNFLTHLDRIEITSKVSGISRRDRQGKRVYPIVHVITLYVKGVDRPQFLSWNCGENIEVAERFQRCIEAGKAIGEATVCTGADGNTYINAECFVRRVGTVSELNRLGF